MLLPALSKAREKARATSCVSNLKQIGLACHLYASDHNDYMPPLGGFGGNAGQFATPWAKNLKTSNYLPSKTNAIYCPSLGPTNQAQASKLTQWDNNYSPDARGENGSIYGMIAPFKDDMGSEWSYGKNYIRVGNPSQFNRYLTPWGGDLPTLTVSTFPLIADSAAIYKDLSGVEQTWKFYWSQDYSSSRRGKVHLRHTRTANVLLLDGHVSGMSYQRLVSEAKFSDKGNARATLASSLYW